MEVTVYECEDRSNCPYKEKCTKAKENKRLYNPKSVLEKCQESYENILSEKGIQYRMNRSIQLEGDFRVLKNDLKKVLDNRENIVYIKYRTFWRSTQAGRRGSPGKGVGR